MSLSGVCRVHPGLGYARGQAEQQSAIMLAVEDQQGLEHATAEQLGRYVLLGRGTRISFPDLDADFNVPALIKGV